MQVAFNQSLKEPQTRTGKGKDFVFQGRIGLINNEYGLTNMTILLMQLAELPKDLSQSKFNSMTVVNTESISVSAMLHGNDQQPNKFYFVDSLQRFKRDFATIDRQQRQSKRWRQQAAFQKRRLQSLQRSESNQRAQLANNEKLVAKQRTSLEDYKVGQRLTMHSKGIPVDPISLQYEPTTRGRHQQLLDHQKIINNLVRAHYLQTCGNSSYNIINGQTTYPIEQLIGQEHIPRFQDKLTRHYDQFKLNPFQHK